MSDDVSTADMARLLLGMSATHGPEMTDPGMAVMTPLPRKPVQGKIPYDTAVSNGPTPMERFVGSLGEFKTKALDMMPVVGSARALAHGYHGYQQGDAAKAVGGALVGGLALPLELMAFARPGAALSTEEALRNFRGGAQMPEHASGMISRMRSVPESYEKRLASEAMSATNGNADMARALIRRNENLTFQQDKEARRLVDSGEWQRPSVQPNVIPEPLRNSIVGQIYGKGAANTAEGLVDPYEAALALQNAAKSRRNVIDDGK